MRLAISNIAWDPSEDDTVAALLRGHGIDAVDVAPSKYFRDPAAATDDQILQVRRQWAERGFEITGMQSLLFGTTGLNVFGGDEVRRALLEHLSAVFRVGAGLGALRLVFGSPRNRDRTGLSDAQVGDIAVPFFQRLGDIAHGLGITICLEPNPVRYGANFLITSAETASFVRRVAHAAVRMQFDTGAVTLNGEDPGQILASHAAVIGHIHASEPDLVPLGDLGDGGTNHGKMAASLRNCLPDAIVAIETVATQREPHLDAIERSLNVAIRHYRDQQSPHRA